MANLANCIHLFGVPDVVSVLRVQVVHFCKHHYYEVIPQVLQESDFKRLMCMFLSKGCL